MCKYVATEFSTCHAKKFISFDENCIRVHLMYVYII